MTTHLQDLRQQINASVTEPILYFEQKIADSLNAQGVFTANVDGDELGLILRKVIYNIVDEQKLGHVQVPVLHSVSQVDARIGQGEAAIFCEIRIHQPIVAFIRMKYTLENDPRFAHTRLRLKKLHVQESTRPLDVAAKVALKVMRVESVIRHELSDPNGLIKRQLPVPLRHRGFDGVID